MSCRTAIKCQQTGSFSARRGNLNSANFLWVLRGSIVAAVLCASGATRGQDVVTVRGPEGDVRQRTGVIRNFNADELILDSKGREQKIPFDQIVDVRSTLDPLAETADQLYAERKFELAFEEYGKGLEASTPAWMRRRLLAGRIRSATQMHAWVQATDDFLTLAQSEPRTQYFGVIPLVWMSSRPDPAVARKIAGWLASKNVLERLIGASHGLTDQNRDTAMRVLSDLAKSADPRIASLAVAQQWRTEVRPSSQTLLQWRSQVAAMPQSLQAGPTFVLGTAMTSSDGEQAVLQLMRIPVLFDLEFELAGRALSQSADQLLKLNRTDEAKIVLQELVERHRGTPEADVAEVTLSKLAGPAGNE